MIERLTESILQRSSWDRILLGCFTAIALPAAIGWGMISPLMERRDAARATVTTAYSERGWLSQMQAERENLLVQMKGMPDTSAELLGLSGLEASLVQAKIRESVTSLGTPANDLVSVRFQEVAFAELMTWLQKIEQSAGYRIVYLRLTEVELPGKVAAEVDLQSISGNADF